MLKGDKGEELTDVDEDVLHSLNAPGLPLHVRKLKIGFPVMLLRNLNARDGLCYGTRLIITRLWGLEILTNLTLKLRINDNPK